jgi:hypothetical protein
VLDKLTVGQPVYAVDDRFIGEIKAVAEHLFRVVGPDLDVWLRADAVFTADQTVTLICNREQVRDYASPDHPGQDGEQRVS